MQHRIRSGTLVVHCSSAAYQPRFREFLTRDLRLDHYALIALPGGVQSLTLGDYLPKYPWAGWHFIKFLMDQDAPSRIILMGHAECLWYNRGPIPPYPRGERERQEADLRAAAQTWAGRFPDTRVELYFAHVHESKAKFDRIG